jgi:hypothetical protein
MRQIYSTLPYPGRNKYFERNSIFTITHFDSVIVCFSNLNRVVNFGG